MNTSELYRFGQSFNYKDDMAPILGSNEHFSKD